VGEFWVAVGHCSEMCKKIYLEVHSAKPAARDQ